LFRRDLLLGRHGGKDRSAFFSLTACNPSDWDKQREKEGKEEQLARGKEREEGNEEKEEQEEEDFVILITSDESLVFHSTSLVVLFFCWRQSAVARRKNIWDSQFPVVALL
jgi:hypothetical protein